MAEKITSVGVINKGDVIIFTYCGVRQVGIVDHVYFPGKQNEEIILENSVSSAMLTKNIINGTSWADDVKYIPMSKELEANNAK